jgi:hypothetical protein
LLRQYSILEYFSMKCDVLNLPLRLRQRPPRLASLWLLAGFLALALLASCGGGGVGTNGTGAANQGVASGTVTGFGSVVVDGVHFDDSTATVKAARSAADDSAGGVKSEVKLGQQLSFSFSGSVQGKGVAQNITLLPTFIGQASVYSVGTSGSSIRVLGLAVNINTDPLQGPVTVIDESVDPTSSLSPGSRVEVHAIQGANGLVATRIEESLATGDMARGIVKVVPSTSPSARIGDLLVDLTAVSKNQTKDYKALALGQNVAVFGSYDSSKAQFVATRLHIDSAPVTSKVDDYLGGYITGLDSIKQTFAVNGVTVDYANTNLNSSVSLKDGFYVRVRGVSVATTSGAVFKASSVSLRKDENLSSGGDAELIGNILSYVKAVETSTTKQPATFSVRSVQVTVPLTLVPDFKSCSGSTELGNGMYVQVKGNTTAAGVDATSIKCDVEPTTAGTTVERVGTVVGSLPSTNTASAGTFQLAVSAQTTIKVSYDSLTYFRSRSPKDGTELILDMPLDVEGVFSGSGDTLVLRATKIKKE